jgi:hypothetical protein
MIRIVEDQEDAPDPRVNRENPDKKETVDPEVAPELLEHQDHQEHQEHRDHRDQ